MAKTAFLLLSSQCNKSCAYCFNKQAPFSKKRKDLVKTIAAEKIFNIFSGLNVKEVVLTGGEPLMFSSRLLSLVNIFSANGIISSLDTNGTLLTRELIEDLSSAGLKNVYLSTRYLEAIDPSIIEYSKNKFKLSLVHVFGSRDYLDLPKAIDKYRSLADNVIAQPAWYGSSQKADCISCLDASEWQKLEETLIRLFPEYRDDMDYLRFAYGRHGRAPKKCNVGKNNFAVYNDGEVYRCFHRQDLRAGNIFKDSVALINKNLLKTAGEVSDANCFGSHCFSLFL